MGIGAALGIGAASSLVGAGLNANAAQSAANTQAQAADQASANQLAEFNQTKATLSPFVGAGTNSLGTLESTLGLQGGNGQNLLAQNGINGLTYQTPSNLASVLSNPTFNPTQASLAATPGYQFDLAQGLQSTANSNAAQGLGVSGAALKGAANYATGLANNTLSTQAGIFNANYQNALNANSQGANIFQSNLGNVLNPLSNLTSLGENAAATTGQQGIQAIGAANNALIGGANAQAAGTVGSTSAITSGLSGASSAPLNYALYSSLLGGSGGLGGLTGGTSDAAATNAIGADTF